jgi:hypothetical protein
MLQLRKKIRKDNQYNKIIELIKEEIKNKGIFFSMPYFNILKKIIFSSEQLKPLILSLIPFICRQEELTRENFEITLFRAFIFKT